MSEVIKPNVPSGMPPLAVENRDLAHLDIGSLPNLKPNDYEIHARIRLDRDQTSLDDGFIWSEIKKFKTYMHGKQPVTFTDKQKKLIAGIDITRFCDNVCYQIVSEAAGRIEFLKWDCKNKEVKDWLDKFNKTAKVSDRQGQWFVNTMRDGNFAVLVNWDAKSETVKVYNEQWWDGFQGVFIHYDPAGEVDYAVKEWQVIQVTDDGQGNPSQVMIRRRIVWFDDHLERWWNTGTAVGFEGWVPYILEDDPKAEDGTPIWPIPWLDDEGNPMGIPYVHLPNFGKTYGPYGVSELDGGVIGFQDCINDEQLSMTITSRLTGGQQYWATGVQIANPDGTPIDMVTEPGKWHLSSGENSKFGVLEAGDIDKQLGSYNNKIKRVSQMTQTPLHLITGGDWPSGEALLRAESPAVNKARNQIKRLEGAFIEMAVKAIQIYNKFRPSSEPAIDYDIDKGIIEAEFADPERRDIVSKSIVVHNMATNISKRESLRMLGYSEEQVQDIYDEMLEEEKDSTAIASDALMRTTPALGGSGNKTSKSAMGGNSKMKGTGGS